MVTMTKEEFAVLTELVLGVKQESQFICEIDIFDDEDWENFDEALKIIRKYQ